MIIIMTLIKIHVNIHKIILNLFKCVICLYERNVPRCRILNTKEYNEQIVVARSGIELLTSCSLGRRTNHFTTTDLQKLHPEIVVITLNQQMTSCVADSPLPSHPSPCFHNLAFTVGGRVFQVLKFAVKVKSWKRITMISEIHVCA